MGVSSPKRPNSLSVTGADATRSVGAVSGGEDCEEGTADCCCFWEGDDTGGGGGGDGLELPSLFLLITGSVFSWSGFLGALFGASRSSSGSR